MPNTQQNAVEKSTVLELAQNTIRVERHLDAELKLVMKLETLNNAIASMLSGADRSGGGLTPKQLDSLNAQSSEIGGEVAQLQKQRQAIHRILNPSDDENQPTISIRKFIQLADPEGARKLDTKRTAIVDRLTTVQAQMVGSQAVFFYSFDFYKKMLAGLLQTNVDQQQYRADGQSVGVEPGNFLRKAV